MLKELFQFVLDNYITNEKKVSSASALYRVLVDEIRIEIRSIFPFRKDLIVKGSMGQGNKTDYPWVSILNKNITFTTKTGRYIVYLFKKDMSSFYLTLDQGITYFTDAYGKKKYESARKVVKYFQDHINDDYFSKELIKLGGTSKGTLGYGYEQTTILSKYYESNNFSEDELINDYKRMMQIYDEIYKNMDTDSYDEIIDRIINSTKTEKEHLDLVEDAINDIRKALTPIDGLPYDFSKQLRQVQPYVDKSTKYKEITNPIISKTDYIKKAKSDAEIGNLGELLVLEYERQRLSNNAFLSKYADKVVRVSVKSDGYGYDIVSYDLFGLEVKKIFIEVKTTKNRVDIEFPVSKGEVDKSKELKKQYFVYRVYDVLKDPKFYRVAGAIEEHFTLDPITYLAKYKG